VVDIGAALSTTVGGILIQRISFQASFLGLVAAALAAFALLWFAVPETLSNDFSSKESPLGRHW
jgi:predicted MFS family arabinose efflux permease